MRYVTEPLETVTKNVKGSMELTCNRTNDRNEPRSGKCVKEG